MVIVGPMARFIISSCCQDQAHAANRRNNDFYTKMKKELAACCRNIKDFLFTSGHRNGRVMDPARSLLGRRSDHPRKDIYDIIAKGVIEVEMTFSSGQTKRKRSNDDGSGYIHCNISGGNGYRGNNHGRGSLNMGGRGGRGSAASGHSVGQDQSWSYPRGRGHRDAGGEATRRQYNRW